MTAEEFFNKNVVWNGTVITNPIQLMEQYHKVANTGHEKCLWKYDGEMHETSCNHGLVWNDGEVPIEIKYCPYCGKKIKSI